MNSRILTALRTDHAEGVEVLRLDDPRAADAALTGGKAANLARLAAAFRVPPGFVVTIPAATLERDARGAITAAYHELGAALGVSEPPVAVRSSAVDEDGRDASFAGQHDTYLNISGAEQVWWAISRCLASFGAERALAYRRAAGLPATPGRVAVLVQALVAADASGVAFSANPVTGARDEVVVNAAWGLGESIVSGTVTPDEIVVGRDELAVRAHAVADKQRMTVPFPGGTREVPVPGRLARMAAVDAAHAVAAAELALALEREMGWPVDVELAWAGSELFLLQCRPITTLSNDRSTA
jgi:phosphoenolpyruvate synthase/pyruvate phosphate dikinase